MTEEELNEVFASLSAILSDSGLEWIVDQVADGIRVGRIVTKTFRPGQPEEVSVLEVGTKPTGNTVIGTEPYGPAERLDLLLSAIRVALIDSADLEHSVAEFFMGERPAQALPTSAFVLSAPDRVILGVEAVVIAGRENAAAAAARRVVPLIDELAGRLAQS